MKYDKLIQELLTLDKYERLGKIHFLKYGNPINTRQLIWLSIHDDHIQNPEILYTPDALAEQEHFGENFVQNNPSNILQSQNYFSEDNHIEIQKLQRFVDIPPHKHDFVEFAYVIRGQCIHQINGKDYIQRSGDFFTIPQGYTHTLFPEENCLCLTIKVRLNAFIEMEFPNRANFALPLAFHCIDDVFIQNSILEIWQQQESRLPYHEQIMHQIFQTVLLYIEQQYHDKVQYLDSGSANDLLMIDIYNYIMDNYQTVTLQSAADYFHYHPAYLSRYFHEHSGITFSGILKEYKLKQAAKLLSERRYKLSEICEKVGYKDTTQFIRSFKELYGITPARYCRNANSEPGIKY